MKKRLLTQETLKEYLYYNEETGVFYWVERPREKFKQSFAYNSFLNNMVGKAAGSVTEDNYVRISVNNVSYKAQQLAWLYVYGHFPEEGYVIDHIDHNRQNNKISNLRCITKAENSQNRSIAVNNKTGIKGVYFDKSKQKYVSKIVKDGVKYRKYSDTIEEAALKRYEMEKEHHEYRSTAYDNMIIKDDITFSEYAKKRMHIPLNLEKFMDEL